MRIGITCYPTYGGSGAVATELGIELGKRGHAVHVISYASPFRLRGYAPNVSFHEVDVTAKYPLFEFFPYDLALAVKQHEVALREKLDVLHVHYAVPHATAAFLAKQMLGEDHPLKVVTTLHGTDITLVGQEKSFFEITKFSIERSDAISAVSKYLRDETYRAFGCDACAIEVIPNFVSLAEYFPSDDVRCRSDLAPRDSKILMHISNFRELKRVPDIIRTFAKVRAKVKSVLILVGDGPEREVSEREAERLGVAKDVKFLGKLDAIADLLRAADVFLLPSATESFGLAALEALACGVPVVATNVGGLPEVVDSTCGALVEVGDIDALAAKSLELLTDSTRWQRARAAAVVKAKQFAAETIVPQYENLYQRVVDG